MRATGFLRCEQAQPDGYTAFIDTGEEQVLSVSPELFFDWHGDRILTRPMKGTAPRGATPAEDEALAQRLRTVPKERAENVMIVDLILQRPLARGPAFLGARAAAVPHRGAADACGR